MTRSELTLRSILLEIDRQLADEERKQLCFLIGSEDVPRRYLDAIIKDPSMHLIDVWQKLFDQQLITIDNVNYLIDRLNRIPRTDLAELLRNYCPLPFSISTQPSRD